MLNKRISNIVIIALVSISMLGCNSNKEDETTSLVQENQVTVQNYVDTQEIKENEWRETTKNEMANNPNFENKYNEIREVYGEYLDNCHYGLPYAMRDKQNEVNYNLKDEYSEKLKSIETEEGTILDEYKYSLILDIKFGYSNDSMDIGNIIIEELCNK